MKLTNILRNGVAGALIACVPVTANLAATRPNAAVPMASSAAVAQGQYEDGQQGGISWVALGAIAIAIGVALFLILDKNSKGEGSVKPGLIPSDTTLLSTTATAGQAPVGQALVSAGIAMPSAEQLLAQGHGVSADHGRPSPLVGQVLLEAGGRHSPIDALLDACRQSAATSLGHLAAIPDPGFATGHGPALSAFGDAFRRSFALETTLHHDATPAA